MTGLVLIGGISAGGKSDYSHAAREYSEISLATDTGMALLSELHDPEEIPPEGWFSHILSTDDCYRDRSDELTYVQRRALCSNPDDNYDNPSMVDRERFLDLTHRAVTGEPFRYSKYNFETHSRQDWDGNTVYEEVRGGLDYVMIEGIFALEVPEVLEQADLLRFFVDTPPEVAVLRRVKRDIKERGRDVPGLLEQLSTTVIPMQRKYTLASRRNAHYIIPWFVEGREAQFAYREQFEQEVQGEMPPEMRVVRVLEKVHEKYPQQNDFLKAIAEFEGPLRDARKRMGKKGMLRRMYDKVHAHHGAVHHHQNLTPLHQLDPTLEFVPRLHRIAEDSFRNL